MPRQITKRARTVESRKKNLLIDNNIQPPPVIKVPCPPIVTCDDFVRNRPKAKVDIKSPNSFFVYRTAFVKQLLSENHKFKMTQVSKWASIYWRKESDKTKMAYKDMAQIIDKEFQERRKKIKGYEIVCENHLYSKPEEVKQVKQEEDIKETIIQKQPIKKDQMPLELINWHQQQRQQRQQKQHRQQQQQQLQRQQQPQQQLLQLQQSEQSQQTQQLQQLQQQHFQCIDFPAVSPKSTSSTYSPICPASPASPISPFIKDEFSLSEFPSINENFYEYIPFENSISPICEFNEKFIWISNDSNPEYYDTPIYVEPTFNEYLPQFYYESEK
ncbi:hypothetical protein RhiirC2_85404 [Rhizophagus irregularis]|uniref:HMG box domain-containing protein n=1 Tax=Rhizophagus irregularis TaxID=588596 RepID=A0A2N1MTD0_9GLOM|nr:hypothetical protein RhiirC2_85404 [Rhizophagus irregularis]